MEDNDKASQKEEAGLGLGEWILRLATAAMGLYGSYEYAGVTGVLQVAGYACACGALFWAGLMSTKPHSNARRLALPIACSLPAPFFAFFGKGPMRWVVVVVPVMALLMAVLLTRSKKPIAEIEQPSGPA
jgi:hypothetical protein